MHNFLEGSSQPELILDFYIKYYMGIRRRITEWDKIAVEYIVAYKCPMPTSCSGIPRASTNRFVSLRRLMVSFL